jgi:CRP/FNR family transcriptional regulator, cyclic AMP receptor protein
MGRGDLVPRIITGFKAAVQYGAEASFKQAWPVNLSETGACIRYKLELPLQAQITLLINLSDEIGPIHVAGRVVWARFDEASRFYYYGVGFSNLGEGPLEQIRKYVDHGSLALLQFMSEFPLFKDFSLDDCRSLLRILTVRELDEKEALYREGVSDLNTQGLFIVQSGLLSVLSGVIPRLEKQVAIVSPGQIFGESSLLIDQPHSATLRAVNPSRLIQINKVGFQLLRNEQPKVALKVLDVVGRTLVARLGRTTKKLFCPIPA